MKKIIEIAQKISLTEDDIELYGKYKAKISNINKFKNNKDGNLILVTSINPTPYGEGKTTITIGLGQGLNKINKKVVLALREPSLGPCFGMKGGATGGGQSSMLPSNDINLHFTGDIHAMTTANNLISALIDNHINFGNKLNIKKVVWKRALDLNDRALRNIIVGVGDNAGKIREDSFQITVASEIMAIMCLAENLQDLRKRLENIIIAYDINNKQITLKDIEGVGAVLALLKDALKPNLVQTTEGVPVLVHGGPFANIAHGCNSVIATKTALKLGDYVITEAGFGADLGAEKFLDIKCRQANLKPKIAVIVATCRSLKYNGGAKDFEIENIDALQKGIVEEGEKIVTSARREVREETNLQIPEEIHYLASKKVSKHKLVIMFYTYFDGDLSSFKSNTFQKEWPKNSGQMKEFFEMDQIRWFSLRDAKKYIHPTQRFFLERLEEKLQV